MRQDFSLMKELSVYTRVGPNERYQQLNGFLNDIKGRAEELAGLIGRFMESESRTDKYNQLDAGGSRDGRSLGHLSAKNLNK
ncbi:unnamed protein product [Rotaria magnacalcarata]|uniref:Uncharacterized protein n=1 Tax=Rotaria magnacalcarata TaxID=392030 RepID=A0A8S3K5I6_9BILA|nr:unnamed protein product [Rotaria magnacalcarata]